MIVTFIISVCIVIFIHELGHYFFAKFLKVDVIDFSIGFGPRIFSFKKFSTKWNIRIIPLGGYVKLESNSQNINSFPNKNLISRILILLGGALFNFKLSLLIIFFLIFKVGYFGTTNVDYVDPLINKTILSGDHIESVNGIKVYTWDDFNLTIINESLENKDIRIKFFSRAINKFYYYNHEYDQAEILTSSNLGLFNFKNSSEIFVENVNKNSNASRLGILKGDIIKELNGIKLINSTHFIILIKNLVNSNNQLSIIRGEEIIYINFKVEQEPYIFGIKLNNKNISSATQNLGFLNSFIGSISFLYKTIKLQIKTLTNLSLKNIEENLGGPIYIMKASNEAASNGVFQFLTFISLLSISIGFINLLPLPLFDGGQIISNTFISLFGNNKLTNKILMLYNFIGIFIFALLIFLLIYYDFKRLL